MLGTFGKLLWRKKKTLGQTVVEYALIVALVAIASITVLTLFGNQLRNLYDYMTDRLAGGTSVEIQNRSTGDTDVGLDDF